MLKDREKKEITIIEVPIKNVIGEYIYLIQNEQTLKIKYRENKNHKICKNIYFLV